MEKIKLTGGFFWALEKFYGAQTLVSKLNPLRTLRDGTVGKEIANLGGILKDQNS